MISGETLKIIGHRGWPTRFPDNVMAGIEAATKVADMIEVDVRLAADGVLVLSHDPHLNGHEVHTSTWAQLADLDLGGGHRPVTLENLLRKFPGFPFNLEIKNYPGDPGFDQDHGLAFLVADRARPDDLLSCFYWPTMDALRISHPDVRTGLLIEVGGSIGDAVNHALELGHEVVVPHWQTARSDPMAVDEARESGLGVTVWTLNDPEMAKDLASIGVTAIITDDPGLMSQALR
ncbi:MAG TPA: glycerophosphodiester phosphodiesterase [Acidimicrobiia bacterium]|nr:glycerophosphodiester phosphodiesterase [Acidimicrobiia bacterium]